MVSRCSSGFKCDCNSNSICQKTSTLQYKTSVTMRSAAIGSVVECKVENVLVPREVVGHTSDFEIMTRGYYEIYIDGEAIGFGGDNTGAVHTGGIKAGSIIGLALRRKGSEPFGIKVRFNDLRDEIRNVDENWIARGDFKEGWMEGKAVYGEGGWKHATLVEDGRLGAGLDKDIAWMWLEDKPVVYMRYRIPTERKG